MMPFCQDLARRRARARSRSVVSRQIMINSCCKLLKQVHVTVCSGVCVCVFASHGCAAAPSFCLLECCRSESNRRARRKVVVPRLSRIPRRQAAATKPQFQQVK